MSQDLSIYTEDYYLRDQIEFYFKREGLLRPDEFDGEITGKGGWAVPILLGLGYDILNDISEDIQGYVLMEKQ